MTEFLHPSEKEGQTVPTAIFQCADRDRASVRDLEGSVSGFGHNACMGIGGFRCLRGHYGVVKTPVDGVNGEARVQWRLGEIVTFSRRRAQRGNGIENG
jgi:hypothetical protein